MRFKLIRALGLVILLANTEMTHALVPTNWLARISGTTRDLQAVTYARGQFVAVGRQGLVLTSTNGSNWTVRATGVNSDLTGVTYGHGLFVAVGKAATVITSADGLSWAAASKVLSGDWEAITFGGGQFVAVGNDGDNIFAVAVRSTDGLKWSWITDGLYWLRALNAVAYGNNGFLAAGNSGDIYALTSFEFDGVTNYTWRSKSSLDPVVIAGLAFGQGRWIACAAEGLWFSDDGANWTASDGCGSYTVISGNDYFVAARRDVCASPDGRNWRLTHPNISPPSPNQDLLGIAYGNNSYVAVGRGGTIVQTGPATFVSRPGGRRDHPNAWFDTSDRPSTRMGLPEYRINTTSLNLVLEGTLFYMETVGAPVDLRLTYNGAPSATNGMFGPGWRLYYEAGLYLAGNQVFLQNGSGKSMVYEVTNNLGSATADLPVELAPSAGLFDRLTWNGSYWLWREKLTRFVYRFDPSTPNGLAPLSSITDRNGNALLLGRDPQTGRLQWIEDTARRRILFAYDGNLHCSVITAPDGRKIQFGYDAQGRLARITDMAGYVGTYGYDPDGFMTETSTAGFTSRFTFVPRPGFPGDKCIASVENAQKGVTRYAIDPAGYGPVEQTLPGGQVWHFQRTDGNTSAIQDPLNQTREALYNQNLPTQVTDSLGKITTFGYDARGNLITTKDDLGNQTKMAYDGRDNLIARTNALGKTWNYAYDGNDRVTSVQTPLRNTTHFTYLSNGRLNNLRDARNNETTSQYDAYGNLTRVTDPLIKSTQFAYDPSGLHCTSLTDPRGKIKSMQYDGNDRLTTVGYDSVGGIPQRVNAFDAFGQTSLTDELGQLTSVTRNEFGYLTSVTDPLGNRASMEYDPNNNPVSVTDPLGRITTTTYDTANRPLVLTDALGKTVKREYDADGNMLSLIDKKTNKTAFKYDANNRLIETKDPLQKTVTLGRDALDRAATVTNARGQVIRYTYDDDGRVAKKEYQETAGGSFVQQAEFTYDPNGNILSRTDDWGTTTFIYDSRNQPTAITYPTGKTVSFTYTDAGQLASITYPNGLTVNYTYDDYNRLVIPARFRNAAGTELQGNSERPNAVTHLVMALSGTTKAIDFTYDKAGNRVSDIRPNNTSTTYEYDPAQRVTNVLHKADANTLLQCNLAYNKVGSVIQETVSGSAQRAPDLPTAATATYNACNQVTSRAGKAYTYDADGNLTAIANGEFSATYTPENRPSQITRKRDAVTETIQYTYDANGLRVKRSVVGDVTTQFHYGLDDRLLFTTDETGNVTASYVWNGPALAAVLIGASLNIDIRYPHLNRLGNVMALTDATGALTVKYAYQSYGFTYRETVPAGGADANLFTFVGGLGVQDEGGGLFYMKNRFYDANTGRFLQRDPIGFEGGVNLYAYVGNNPLNAVDPGGLISRDEALMAEPGNRNKGLYDPTIAIGFDAFAKVFHKTVKELFLKTPGKVVYDAAREKSGSEIAISVLVKRPVKALIMTGLGLTSGGASIVAGLVVDAAVDAAEPVVSDAIQSTVDSAHEEIKEGEKGAVQGFRNYINTGAVFVAPEDQE